MSITGVVRTPQQIPNPQVLRSGEQGTRVFFPLPVTPQVHTVIHAGASNQDFAIRAVPHDISARFVTKGSRIVRVVAGTLGTASASLDVSFNVATAGQNLSSGTGASLQVTFTATTAGVKTTSGTVALPITFSVNSRPSGGLILTPEEQVTETLTAESADSHTLSAEAATSLTLIPEQ